jgi:hypothetical protein
MRIALGLVLIAVISVGVLFMVNGVGFFAPSRKPRPEDDPEVITGLIVRVTRAIGEAATGAIAYTIEGSRRELAARSVDGSSIPAGEDVVIERIDDGTAFVERWEVVEGRI